MKRTSQGKKKRSKKSAKVIEEKKFFARPGHGLSQKDAEIVGRELDKLGGLDSVTPGQIVASAKKKNSPLHRYFQWDDAKAADKYRLEQARALVRGVQIEIVPLGVPLRIQSHINRRDGKGYMPTREAVNHDDLMDDYEELCRRDLAHIWKKYEVVRRARGKLAPVFDSIEKHVMKAKPANNGKKAQKKAA